MSTTIATAAKEARKALNEHYANETAKVFYSTMRNSIFVVIEDPGMGLTHFYPSNILGYGEVSAVELRGYYINILKVPSLEGFKSAKDCYRYFN